MNEAAGARAERKHEQHVDDRGERNREVVQASHSE